MIFDLCIGGNEVFWEFKDEKLRDLVWENVQKNFGWKEGWAHRQGFGKHSARFQIVFDIHAIPISYRWHCVFDSPELAEQEGILRRLLKMKEEGKIREEDFSDIDAAEILFNDIRKVLR